ncbi:MAG: 16S rRNA (cytosine(1402)-N(4))-methyltransferase RsmH [bacterium]|nr:16S rRNA (cytosine(1402)-N(4))-methyltransferase RsmH [bacterium]MDZ4296681.1 16S rRNA (cytosine(1402)-N(4))-methyltransferase RsmH [Patescibacteria group bacterium]
MHIPVLTREVLEYLDVQPGRNYIDATANGGGDAFAILTKNSPGGRVLGIDRDHSAIERLTSEAALRGLGGRLIAVEGNFSELRTVVAAQRFGPVHGVLFDLGLSSWQLEGSGRGFSYLKDEPLDMRFGGGAPGAAEILNTAPAAELERMLSEYGEERDARRIAAAVLEARRARPIERTRELVDLLFKAKGLGHAALRPYLVSRVATRAFQALRIAVNDELKHLVAALPQALEALVPKGRLAVISFHSLEDRIVKKAFRDFAREGLGAVLTKKPITPQPNERRGNPRARSAKLRAFAKGEASV